MNKSVTSKDINKALPIFLKNQIIAQLLQVATEQYGAFLERAKACIKSNSEENQDILIQEFVEMLALIYAANITTEKLIQELKDVPDIDAVSRETAEHILNELENIKQKVQDE